MVVLRSPRRGELGQLREMVEKTAAFSPEEVRCAVELVEQAWEDDGPNRYRALCAADEEDRPVGIALYGRRPLTQASFDLYWIVVAPSHQGRGVGRALLERVEEELRLEGGRLLLVETSSRPTYARAREFYEGAGYSRLVIIEDLYAEGDHLVVYAKRLAPRSSQERTAA